MLRLDPDRIRLLQGSGGVPFTEFVDGLLRTHAFVGRIPDSEIATNIRTTRPDGGVDAVVRRPWAEDETGYLNTPTVWQYKATAAQHVPRATELLAGDYVRQCITTEGCAFRLAVADSFAAAEKERRAIDLTRQCRQISPGVPEAMVVTADDLAAWASRYPGYVLQWFFPELEDRMLHLDAWGPSVSGATPTFISVPDWNLIEVQLREHVDLARQPASVVRTVQGEAGIGKSRLVYEVLRGTSAMRGLVLYCNDEERAVDVARALANALHPVPALAVLVADECGPGRREQLRRILQGHRARVRVVAMDNSALRPASEDPELWLAKMPEASLEEVLGANFGHIPRERRRAYASLAREYPRLAADLCDHDAEIVAAGGSVDAAVPRIGVFLHTRLGRERLAALEALSLVTRVGYRGDVRAELGTLCDLIGLQPETMLQALREIHDGPGFVAQAGRYYYVTPEIVARIGFEGAWARWAGDDPPAFLSRLGEPLLSAFLERVQRSADEEVRRVCGEYFRGWLEHLRPGHLTDRSIAERLVTLVDADPTDYLPRLRRLIEDASWDSLRAVTGKAVNGEWGARRAFVWLAERLVRLPEHFDDCERILVRLAAAESEPEIGNNATAIWQQLFRVHLSGTATPFKDRLARLSTRLRALEAGVRVLAVRALKPIFSSEASRWEGPPVVGGRIPPAEWMPRTRQEEGACFRSALALVEETIEGADSDAAQALREMLARLARWFIAQGYLQEVRRIFDRASIDDGLRAVLLEALDDFLIYDAPKVADRGQALVDSARAWRDSLTGDDLHSRLVAVVSKPRWSATRLDDRSWQVGLEALAGDLVRAPGALRAELPWLFGEQAMAAGELGLEIGRRDGATAFLADVLDVALRQDSRAFARGYVRGLLAIRPACAESVNRWLDEREATAPRVVADLAMAGGSLTRAFDRLLRMFDRGVLPAGLLYEQNFDAGRRIPDEQFEELVSRLALAAAGGDDDAVRVGLDVLALRCGGQDLGDDGDGDGLLERAGVLSAAWTLVGEAVRRRGHGSHWWGKILRTLARLDPKRAARLASRTLVAGALERSREAARILGDLAKLHPAEVMESLGEVMLDEEHGWKFHALSFRELVSRLPTQIVMAWLKRVGVEGALRLARHLPAPYLTEERSPVVPPLTEWVLSAFADDDRVFREFCAGVHSFQMYGGDIAGQHEAEASVARAFRDHPLRRIRQWAQDEEQDAMAEARRAREEEEEDQLP